MKEQNFVIDMHAHIGDYANFYMPDVSLDRLFSVYDSCKVRCCIVSHVIGLYSHAFAYGNEQTFALAAQHPGKIFGYAVYDPHYAEDSLENVKSYIDHPGFCGVKIYPSGHGYPLDGENYIPIWELASKYQFPILTHTWDPNPKRTDPFDWDSVFAQPNLLDSVARSYPDIRIIMAHSGGHFDGYKQAVAMTKKHSNLYVDVCGEPIDYGFIEWITHQVGSNRVLFGTDQNWIDPRAMLYRVLAADISSEDKERILYKNSLELFGDRLNV